MLVRLPVGFGGALFVSECAILTVQLKLPKSDYPFTRVFQMTSITLIVIASIFVDWVLALATGQQVGVPASGSNQVLDWIYVAASLLYVLFLTSLSS